MEKVAKVISRTFKSKYDGPNGTLYNFEIEIEGGEKGNYASTKQDPSSFVPGQEQKYTVEVKSGTSKSGRPYSFNQFKPVKENKFGSGGGKSKPNPFQQSFILAQSSFQKAIDLAIAGKIELSQVQVAAEKFMKQQIESATKFTEIIKNELDKE